ncbi:MAG: chorismate mutase [Tenericutes bacterium]|nr:chorismate mutase [Mycoplasmatota bacterium]
MKDLRNQIDIIDEAIQNLFLERMQIVKQVAEYKLENNLPVLDKSRELEIIQKNVDKINDSELQDLYEEFYKKMIEVSKKYQERIIG